MALTQQSSNTIRIFVLNDHLSFVQALKRFLDAEHDLEVVGTGHAAPDGLGPVIDAQPDVVILDPEAYALEVGDMVHTLRDFIPRVRLIVLTFSEDDRIRQGALQAGADDFIEKMTAADNLVPSIRRARPGSQPGSQPPGR